MLRADELIIFFKFLIYNNKNYKRPKKHIYIDFISRFIISEKN